MGKAAGSDFRTHMRAARPPPPARPRTPPRTPPRTQPGCASWARNPKGPKITPFCHQMGRHPTIWDAGHGFLHRISARISPDRSHPLKLNFFLDHFWTKNAQNRDSGRKKMPLQGTPQSLATWVGNNTPLGALGGPGGPAGRPEF